MREKNNTTFRGVEEQTVRKSFAVCAVSCRLHLFVLAPWIQIHENGLRAGQTGHARYKTFFRMTQGPPIVKKKNVSVRLDPTESDSR